VTSAPADLLSFRSAVMRTTGFTNPVEVGIAPDEHHVKGYHVGVSAIRAAGNFDNDYSTRQVRDRSVGGNEASAMDIGDDWPHGGRSAWIRFNNLLVAALKVADPALVAVRAINFSPDGTAKKRFDTANRSQGVISSTDTVNIHTHVEWWRNTINARQASFARILQLMDAAINPRTESTPATPETPMPFIAKDTTTGQYYVCDLVHSRPVPPFAVPDVLYLAKQMGYGHGAEGAEWGDGGWSRLGWTEAAFGTVLRDPVVTVTDEQVTAQANLIADRLIASGANGLTAADHAGVVADLKQALREGSGTP
jgi:hypothetical protein